MPRHTHPYLAQKHSRAHVRLQSRRYRRRRLQVIEHEHLDTFELASDLRRHTRLTLDVWGMRFLCDPRNRLHSCAGPRCGRPHCRDQQAARQLFDYLDTTPQVGPVYTLTLAETLRLPRQAREWLGLSALDHLSDRLHRGRAFWERDWELPLSERSAQRKRRHDWRRDLESELLSEDGQLNGHASAKT